MPPNGRDRGDRLRCERLRERDREGDRCRERDREAARPRRRELSAWEPGCMRVRELERGRWRASPPDRIMLLVVQGVRATTEGCSGRLCVGCGTTHGPVGGCGLARCDQHQREGLDDRGSEGRERGTARVHTHASPRAHVHTHHPCSGVQPGGPGGDGRARVARLYLQRPKRTQKGFCKPCDGGRPGPVV